MRVDEVCDRFEAAWRAGQQPRVEDYLGEVSELERSAFLRELIPLEVEYRRQRGEDPQSEEYHKRFPSLVPGFIASAVMRPTRTTGAELQAGEKIGKYTVLEKLGSGGMGSVYLCSHKLMSRRVAVKVLLTAETNNPSWVERFYREARAVATCDHPNIVRGYDVDCADNMHFLVLEYVDGGDLSKLVGKCGPLPVAKACNYAWQAAQGLQGAHQQGLVHRDIKPQNLLLGCNDLGEHTVVKISDFGLARFFDDTDLGGPRMVTAAGDLRLTDTGIFLGTLNYMAPEQAYDAKSADIRADIFSLGCTLFYLLTGRSPFPGRTLPEKLAAWRAAPTPVCSLRPDVPPGIADTLTRTLVHEAAGRYQTPAELAVALTPFASGPGSP
jgi:serine/threonine protein kinase